MKKNIIFTLIILACLAQLFGTRPHVITTPYPQNTETPIGNFHQNSLLADDLIGSRQSTQPEGTGTQTNPYQISNLANLRWLSENGYEAGAWTNKYFVQTANIDASETVNWNNGDGLIPIGSYDFPFQGYYNGGQYTITNLFISTPFTGLFLAYETALFGFITNSVIENIVLENAYVSGYTCVAGVVGTAYYSIIENCSISGIVTSHGNLQLMSYVGGIVAVLDTTTVKNCISTVRVVSLSEYLTLFNAVGGIVGAAWRSTIEDCTSYGDVSDEDYAGYVGGVVGYLVFGSTVKNSSAFGNISAIGEEVQFAGGIVGVLLESNIVSCSFSGDVSAISSGTKHFKSAGAGGIVGIAAAPAGGNSFISYCNSEGSVLANSKNTDMIWAGGISGSLESSSIQFSYSTSNLASGRGVGGVAGGLVELSNINNSFFLGSIKGGFLDSSGGIAGELFPGTSVYNCYVSAIDEFMSHGLVGTVHADTLGTIATVTNSFWDVDTTCAETAYAINEGNVVNSLGLTTTQMLMQESYTDWDFINIWGINPSLNMGYPYLLDNDIPLADKTDYHEIEEIKQNYTALLHANYPNPFNPTTTIAFDMAVDGVVVIDIYNIRGQRVKSLVNEYYRAGEHNVVWNGVDDNNREVSSGVYFYRMQTIGFTATRRMLLLK